MLEIRNWEVYGLERSLKASGNAMTTGDINTKNTDTFTDTLDEGLSRGKKLGSAPVGSGHDNFLSGIDVYYDVKYSMYWSMEFQRYHFNQIISSQSKMNKLTSMSGDYEKFKDMFNEHVDPDILSTVYSLITLYNSIDTTRSSYKYTIFMKIISNLPAGFEQWMTIKTNYLQLKTMYNQRKNHRLKDDWGYFCEWCEGLPMFKELIGIKE